MHLLRGDGEAGDSGLISLFGAQCEWMAKPVARVFGMVGPAIALTVPQWAIPQALANQPTWSQSPATTTELQWATTSTAELAGKPLAWTILSPSEARVEAAGSGQQAGSTTPADPTPTASPSTEPAKTNQQNPWIIGIGGGARIGAGEPTYPMVYGRLGRMLDKNASLSLRPRYIFGNSDLQGRSNNEGAFQMPLTLDLKATSWLNPYLGGGIATNTDSTGKTNGMLSAGTDILINPYLAIDLGVNYIFQSNSSDANNGDFEFTSVLYLRF
jgi:opacity protein-like surface antigen